MFMFDDDISATDGERNIFQTQNNSKY